jgi:hypothetical protein
VLLTVKNAANQRFNCGGLVSARSETALTDTNFVAWVSPDYNSAVNLVVPS